VRAVFAGPGTAAPSSGAVAELRRLAIEDSPPTAGARPAGVGTPGEPTPSNGGSAPEGRGLPEGDQSQLRRLKIT
jgi:hypothetical protein